MSDWFDEAFAGASLMLILRGLGVDRTTQAAQLAWDLGLDAIEVPLQTDEDEQALRALAQLAASRGKVVGAGTIITAQQVAAAQAAGAAYLVSPGIDPAIVHASRDAGIPILPGVATPTDVQLAASLGLTWAKAFPAGWLGGEWFRHIRGPFPQMRFVATGGVNADNMLSFLDSGASVVAVGSALTDPAQLAALRATLREWGR